VKYKENLQGRKEGTVFSLRTVNLPVPAVNWGGSKRLGGGEDHTQEKTKKLGKPDNKYLVPIKESPQENGRKVMALGGSI